MMDAIFVAQVKGYKNAKSIPLEDMKSLLSKDNSLNLSHSKWFRNLAEGNILIKEQVYKLSRTENKREFIYENGVAVNTRAFNILYSKRIKSIT